ncbi:energy-coupling factor transporter ATPase [Bifidobacterium scardovii]|uniref:energy-coupling factor transporter ATPase n=1 Tax=Bifidobacterium scardovii TaxID=158787 RepID=UPI00241E7BDC|nr:energy-coupling factor transporter ATPase [Bifidobacterium scardovii]
MHSAPAADLTGIRFSYDGGATWALDGVDLVIRRGEYVCLTGPNGSGKSTLSHILAGLAAPDAGTVVLLGHTAFDGAAHPEAYRAARHGIGAVFQNPEDQIVTTVVEDDVAFGPENLGLDHPLIGRRIADSLHAVDMAAHRADDPTRMSGGQQQRVAIAGMLAMGPDMLVLDEPTAMLDPAARAEVMRILDERHAQGTTIVHVTHHQDETAHADRVIRLERGRLVPADNAAGPAAADDVAADGDAAPAGSAAQPGNDAGDGAPHADGMGSGRTPVIDIRHLSYRYPDAPSPAISDLSLSVGQGEIVAIMGENGAGKSTLARLICALDWPDAGSISVDGIPVAAPKPSRGTGAAAGTPRMLNRRQRERLRRTVGLVMQHPERQLFADTVAEDVAYGPRNQHLDEAAVAQRVREALRLLRIGHLADRSPFDLSGGQRRLAAIAGVIACQPAVLVMDEPTAGLDAAASARIRELILDLRRRGVTTLIITHSRREARLLGARIVTMPAAPAADAATAVEATGEGGNNAAEAAEPVGTGRESLIARLDPRVKMVSFLAMMFAAFAINTPAQLLLGIAAIAGITALARITPMRLVASVHMFLAMFVVFGLLNVFFVRTGTPVAHLGPIPITDDGIVIAILYACRFALVVMLGALMLETTTPTAMTDAFGSLLSPLRRFGLHAQEIALVMSLALRFLPTLGTEARSIADAQAARGGSIETGSPAARVKAMVAIIVPVFAGTLRHADNLSLALDARCYEEGIRRTHWRELRVRPRDAAFAAATLAYIAALVALLALR